MTRQLKAIAVGCALAMTGSGAVQAVVEMEALPDVEEGFEIGFFVKEPHIISPSAFCFDKHGRLYVGAGPKYRHPRPDETRFAGHEPAHWRGVDSAQACDRDGADGEHRPPALGQRPAI